MSSKSLFATLLLAVCLPSYAAPDAGQVRYRLPDDHSWIKGPSGKHRMSHVYDLGAYKNAVVKESVPKYWRPVLGMAISRDGRYGTAVLKYIPYPRCAYTKGKDGCSITATKGKVRRDFAIHYEWPGELNIEDMRAFVDFVDGPGHFTLSIVDEKRRRLTYAF